MTMMALTRKRHRAAHLWALALGLLVVGLVGLGLRGTQVNAIAENTVVLSVTQSPAAPDTVQVGSTVVYTVNATTNIPTGLLVEFNYPEGALTYVSGASTPPGVACTNNAPVGGVVRCDYAPPLQQVPATTLTPLTLTFVANSTFTSAPGDFVVRSHSADNVTDPASDGDDSTSGLGTLTTFGPALIATSGTPEFATVFEGKSFTYTTTITNNSGASTGSFTGSAVFSNVTVTNIICSSGTGGGLGGATATCNGANLAPTETLTITSTVIAGNSVDGSDITAAVAAPALGILQSLTGVAVNEVGLDFTGSTLAASTPLNVCTAVVVSDTADDSAAGLAQTGTDAVVGGMSANPLLNLTDFQVSGPGVGTVSAASGCGASQSGVAFTPSSSGLYTVTALYNTGGTNVLSLTVGGGPANNPPPTASFLSPSSGNAGSGDFTLTVTGTGFVNGVTVVRWNGNPLTTTVTSATTADAAVPGANIATAGSASVTVFNPTPGGGTSGPLTFTISSAPNPIPTISGVSPNSIGAGSAQFPITVTGTNFVAGSVVRWDSTNLATTFGSPTSLTATVPASLVTTSGAANITVFNPAPGGGISVTPQTFTITPGAAKLAFTTQPGAGVAGNALDAQPTVAVQTAANATVTGDSTTVVTLALNGAGTLTCTGGLSKTVVAGVAAFAGCSVTPAATGYTITASATGLTSATSGLFDVSAAPPTSSSEVTVGNPTNAPIPRSRLNFAVSTGALNSTAVAFIIKRDSDGMYWNHATEEWQEDLVLNTATHGAGSAWTLAIEGEARRLFVNTTVTLEARVTVGTTIYRNATIPELTIR